MVSFYEEESYMKAMRTVWNGAAAVRRRIMGGRELYGRREGWGGEYRKRPPSGSHSAPLGWWSTVFLSGIFRAHNKPAQWYGIVAW